MLLTKNEDLSIINSGTVIFKGDGQGLYEIFLIFDKNNFILLLIYEDCKMQF